MKTKSIALLTAACLLTAGIAVAAGPPSWGDAACADGIAWTDCAGEAAPDLKCTDLAVPADWRRPGGERITVRLAKIPAKHPGQRAEPLLVNLGADGATATGLPAEKTRLAELTQWYDVIAFDARGRGASRGIECAPAPNFISLMFALDRQTWRQFTDANRAWEADCRQAAGPLADSLDSWQVAHDMEAIRAALDTAQLTYYGNSYGTVFGKAYAELFPAKVNRMYLDSVGHHSARSPLELVAPMAKSTRDAFRQFGTWCETNPECALYPRNAQDVWDQLIARARRAPLPAPNAGPGAVVGPQHLHFAAFSSVPKRSRWPKFAQSLAQARAGDASALYLDPSTVPSPVRADALAWCADFPFSQGWGSMSALERQLRRIDPRAGWLMAKMYYGRCVGLRHQGTFPPHSIAPKGLSPVLLVSGLRDVTTPPAGAAALVKQLPGAAWLKADADHAVYLDGNRCVRDLTHRYLRTGELPKPGRVCPA